MSDKIFSMVIGTLPKQMQGLARVRRCGSCDVCCYVKSVDGILEGGAQKPSDSLCPIVIPANKDKGRCGLYPNHPEVCRLYYCTWRMGFGGPHDRPNDLGVLIDLEPHEDNRAKVVIRPDDRVRFDPHRVFKVVAPFFSLGELLMGIGIAPWGHREGALMGFAPDEPTLLWELEERANTHPLDREESNEEDE